jgi:opacity protein-like surface antigen
MIRKFATVSVFRAVPTVIFFLATVLAGANAASAQQTPAQQTPAQQTPSQPAQTQQPQTQQQPADQSGSQEATPEETESARKPKPHDYQNWVFNVGGGTGVTSGTTKSYARGGGGIAAVGVAHNSNKYFGFRTDFQWDDLPLRNSALQLAQAPGGSSYALAFMFDPIINIPATNEWSGYVVFGPSYVHRSGKLDSSGVLPGSACNGFWTWWGACFAGSLPLDNKVLSASQNEFGYNFGGGVARKVSGKIEVYVEFRYLHGTHGGITTDLRPITIGVRW